MRRDGRWLRGRESITAEIDLGGSVHRVSWRRGRLILHDHDVAAEDVLLALGGEPCVCLLVRDAFRERAEMPLRGWRPLQYTRTLGPSAASAVARAVQGGRVVLRSRSSFFSTPSGPSRMARQQLQTVQSDPNFAHMPGQERDKILAHLRYLAAIESIPDAMITLLEEARQIGQSRRAERATPVRIPPQLDLVLESSALPPLKAAIRSSRAHQRTYGELTIKCWRQPAGMAAQVDGHIGKSGGFVNVSLCLSWLNRVLMRGLANVDGSFVLEVDAPAPASRVRGRAVRWERRAAGDSVPVAQECLIFKLGHEWRLAWC